MSQVIVFGATGGVGSAAALTAAKEGAQVALAMRDTTKSIPGLTSDIEKTYNFSRVTADLTDPESIQAAVKSTNAKRAFMYFAHQSKDFMRSAVEALKAAGIEYVVFLSSRDVPNEAADADKEELIAYIHAKVELNLREVFGPENYAAVRPGSFATNLLRYKSAIHAGKVGIYGPEMEEDHIDPKDIGAVAGSILATGLKSDKRDVYVFGPQLVTLQSTIETMARFLGKNVEIEHLTPEQGIEQQVSTGVPRPIAVYLETTTRRAVETGVWPGKDFYQEGVENVRLYKGVSGTTFQEWLEDNKAQFEQ